MAAPSRRRRPPASRRQQLPVGQWLGGRYRLPEVTIAGVLQQPFVDVWMDAVSGKLIELVLHADSALPELAQSLREAVRKAGMPAQLRIADAQAAGSLRVAMPAISVVVAPTPELDDVIDEMLTALQVADVAPWADSGAPEATIGSLFAAARRLFRLAPWRSAGDDDVLHVAIPALDLAEGWVCFLGTDGPVPGYLLFPTYGDLERYVAHAEAADAAEDAAASADAESADSTFDYTLLALTFDERSLLPDAVQEEIDAAGWAVAGPAAYPTLARMSGSGPLTLRAEDVQIVAASTHGIAEFVERYRHDMDRVRADGAEGSFVTPDGIEVHVAVSADSDDAEESSDD